MRPFGALRAGDATQTLDLCENVIAVHGVLDGVARDKMSPSSCGIGESGTTKP